MKLKDKAPEKEICKMGVEGGEVRVDGCEDMGTAASADAGN